MEYQLFSPTSHKIKAVVYGPSGSGKTFFAATAPNPIFASAEAGLLSTIKHKNKRIPYRKITTVEDLRRFLKDLKADIAAGKLEFDTVVIDSITEINEVIKEGLEKKRSGQMIQKDWGDLLKMIRGILREFRDLDMHVIFIAQEKYEKDEQKTEKIVPELNGKAATEIARFMDIVAYTYVNKLGEHKITAQPSDKLLTKCRGIDLEPDAPTDFTEWVLEMAKVELAPEETVNAQQSQPAVVVIKPETSKAIYSQWRILYATMGRDPKDEMAVLQATVAKEFQKNTVNDLTQPEGIILLDKIKKVIKEGKAPKAKVEAPKELDTPPPQAPTEENVIV